MFTIKNKIGIPILIILECKCIYSVEKKAIKIPQELR